MQCHLHYCPHPLLRRPLPPSSSSPPFSHLPSLIFLLSPAFSHLTSLIPLLSSHFSHLSSLTCLLSPSFSHLPSLTSLLSYTFRYHYLPSDTILSSFFPPSFPPSFPFLSSSSSLFPSSFTFTYSSSKAGPPRIPLKRFLGTPNVLESAENPIFGPFWDSHHLDHPCLYLNLTKLSRSDHLLSQIIAPPSDSVITLPAKRRR